MSYSKKPRKQPQGPKMIDGLLSGNRATAFVPTTDDWSPSYALGTPCYPTNEESPKYVRVSLHPHIARVCVWGGDDTGMECDFENESDARRVFFHLLQLPVVNFADLVKLQFRRA